MVRRGDHKLIENRKIGERVLFDLGADPGEEHNLARDPAHADLLADLSGLLDAELRASPAGAPSPI